MRMLHDRHVHVPRILMSGRRGLARAQGSNPTRRLRLHAAVKLCGTTSGSFPLLCLRPTPYRAGWSGTGGDAG
jgi:hypothetical protein